MRVSRVQFDDSEPTESIVNRIACAFDPGNILKVRGNFFRMSPQRVMNQTIADNVVGDIYTLILNPGEPIPESLVKAPPPPVVAKDPEPEPEDDPWDEEPQVEAVADPEPRTSPPESVVELEPDPPILAEVESPPALPLPDSNPPPAASEVFMSRPPPSIDGKPLDVSDLAPTPTSESGEYRIELPKSRVPVEVGQVWQSRDTRRQTPPFVVKKIDSEFVYQDNGKKVSITRMIRYKRVS